jgi:hypothetical protein
MADMAKRAAARLGAPLKAIRSALATAGAARR